MTVVAVYQVAQRYGRCAAFFRAAVRLGLLRAVKSRPVTVIDDELEAFVRGLSPQVIDQVNRRLHASRNRKKTPPLAERSKPGAKPGSGLVSRIRRSEASMTTAPAGGTGRSTQ